ncbi:peptidoglycan-binding protein [Dactylosporangium siamense]|uniref:Peptidoglycan-binding protein n=1 Tax=Dactylosporangium siamense TaxID=685454 RepID=A0A919UHK3_9ACTN|nr:peptidoglycan-binding domain-containing protein [Dactylosporangium siamense]GIG52481.1 peptidoglycan-binding protein [Dactylosporangium siamense]
MSRTSKVVTGVALIGVAGVAGLVTTEQLRHHDGPPVPTAVSTSTAEVTRKTISERQYVSGTLGYAGSYALTAGGQGTLTWVPPIGTVVNRGDPLYEVDGQRVTLMYGGRPAWRDFTSGMTDGVDVEQLEGNLRDLGFGQGLTVDQKFTSATYAAIRRWQQAVHLPVTGAVGLGAITFLPGAFRVSGHETKPGAQVHPGEPVETGTSNTPSVNLSVSTQQLGWIKVDTPVVVILPDGKSRNGKVSAIGAATAAAATGGGANSNNGSTGGATVAVTLSIEGEITGFIDQASVQVWVIRATHPDVLIVPIAALNSVSDGKYDVIVVGATGTKRVPVQTGLFDDLAGLAEVSGDGISEGQKVQVPSENG